MKSGTRSLEMNEEQRQLAAVIAAVGLEEAEMVVLCWKEKGGRFNFRADVNPRFVPLVRKMQALTDAFFAGPRVDEQYVEHEGPLGEIDAP